MKKKFIIILAVFALAISWPALAKPSRLPAVVGPAGRTVTIPAKAIQVAPSIFYLGQAFDLETGKLVEGYAFLKYKRDYGKSGAVCGNGICEPGENARKCPADCGGGWPDTSSCYEYLARGAKWKTLEPYMVDASTSEPLSEGFIRSNVSFNISKWEAAAGANILGSEVAGTVDGADEIAPDGKNELMFGQIDEPGVIAVTIIWGIFGGPPKFRELVEWDQVYDDEDYDWSDSGGVGRMDFENIATHELGHSVGMADLYTAGCSEQTMYGYADFGETKKQTLEVGDITGIDKLY